MLKKTILLALILLLSSAANASFWEALGKCFKNPCDCGADGNRVEEWGGRPSRSFPENRLCPPWNKAGGRDKGTCLLQFDYPGIFIPWYVQHCAEETAESSYSAPKIRLRAQECNSFACWTLDKTLNWDGECAVWPTPWGLPLLRICARVAIPEDNVRGLPADPGYTFRRHLNREGALVPDVPLEGVDNQPVYVDGPKLCAYRDPSMLDIISISGLNLDLMDWNPTRQPIHRTKEVHPVVKVILKFMDFVKNSTTSLADLIGSLLDKLGGLVIPGLNVFKPILEVLGKILGFAIDLLEALFKELGQINRRVDDYQFGCVNLPLGPLPPPYCPKLEPYKPMVSVQKVCPLGPPERSGIRPPIKSSMDAPCVVSNLVNNSIRNTIRIGYDDFMPDCSKVKGTPKPGQCINLKLPFGSAEAFHKTGLGKDLIKPCSKTSGKAPCVDTSGTDIPATEEEFRIVYATKAGESYIPSNYFYDFVDEKQTERIVDCGNSINCQVIWGINKGRYVDVTLAFRQNENNAEFPLVEKATLQDNNGKSRAFEARIVRQPDPIESLDFTQKNTDICVFENGTEAAEPLELIGCVSRVSPPKPFLYDCSSGKHGLTCNNTYFAPAMIISLTEGKDYTAGVLEALIVGKPEAKNYKINLAGYDFTAYVTDETYITKPFIGAKSFNPTSIYGNYVDGAAPYDKDQNPTNAVYLSGLEYINDQYIQGGTRICLESNQTDKCPINPTLCVISKLLNSSIVDCEKFKEKSTKYLGLRLCEKKDTNCTDADTIRGLSGGRGIDIKKCDTGYCYTSSNNKEVCKLSYAPEDRVYPSPSQSTTLDDNQFYDLDKGNELVDKYNEPNNNTKDDYSNVGKGYRYNKKLLVLRDKSATERGLCVTVPQPQCAEVKENNIIWPATSVGKAVTGKCITGHIPSSPAPLVRNCVSNAENKSIKFTPLPKEMSCVPPKNK